MIYIALTVTTMLTVINVFAALHVNGLLTEIVRLTDEFKVLMDRLQ